MGVSSERKKKRKRARSALLQFRDKVKNKKELIEKLENYNEKIQEWNDLLSDLENILKEFGVELDPKIEEKLEEISETVDIFDTSHESVLDKLLNNLDTALSSLNRTFNTLNPPNAIAAKMGNLSGIKLAAIILGIGAVGGGIFLTIPDEPGNQFPDEPKVEPEDDFTGETNIELDTEILIFGSSGNGNGEFNWPTDVAIDSSDRIIVTDVGNNRLQIFDSNGNHIMNFGQLGFEKDMRLFQPRGVAVDSQDRIIVAASDYDIQIYDSSGNLLHDFRPYGFKPTFATNPRGVAVDNQDRIIVLDGNGIQIYDSSGSYIKTLILDTNPDNKIDLDPFGIAVDSKNRIIVLDGYKRIQVFNSNGSHLKTFPVFQLIEGQKNWGGDVEVDSQNRIIVVESNNSISIFDSSGSFIQTLGSTEQGRDYLGRPVGVAVDSSDRIVVSDRGDRILIFPPI